MPTEAVIAELQARGLQTFTQTMGQATRATRGVGEGAAQAGEGSKRSAAGLLKAAVAAGAVYKGYQALKSSVNTTIELAKSTAAFASATGMDTKQAGAWVAVAKQRGIQTKQLQMGMATLGRNLGATGGAAISGANALAKLGLSQAQLNAMPTQQRMETIADAFQRLGPGVDRAALAQKLFGRSGQALVPILGQGAAGLRSQLSTASRLIPVTAKSQAEAAKMAQAQREWGMATEGLKVAIGTALIPILGGIAKVLTPIVGKFAQLMQQSPVLRTVITALAIGLGIAAAATWAFNAALFANPITWIILAIVALGAAIYLVVSKFSWGWNVIKTIFMTTFGLVAIPVLAFIWWKDQIIGAVVAVWNAVVGFVGKLAGAVASIAAAAARLVSAMMSALGSLAGKMWSVATNTINALVSGFSGAFNRVWQIGWKLIETIISGIKAGAKAVADAVKSIIPDVGGIAGGLINKAKSVVTGATGKVIAAQGGAAVGGGGRQLVGERGPELVNFPSGTRITPLPPPSLLPSQLGGGGGGGQVVVPVYLDRRQIALAMGSYSADQAASR